MEVCVIYASPKDYPYKFVLRKHTVTPAGIVPKAFPSAVFSSLDLVRACVPGDKIRMERDPRDVRSILEVWI